MEQIVSAGIIDSYFKKLNENLSVDVTIVGGGQSGLVTSNYLAKKGFIVALYESKLTSDYLDEHYFSLQEKF